MNDAVIDPAVFGEMQDLMDDALPAFIETYLDNSPKLLEQIEQAVAEEDAESIFQSAHQLKGGSGSIGAMTVFQLAKEIEVIAKEGGLGEPLGALFDELKSAYAAAAAELKSHL